MNLFDRPKDMRTRWASFENPRGEKGAGGMTNRGAKGHAFDRMAPGQTYELMNVQESGVVRRIWITVSDRSEQMLRGLRLRAYWDGSEQPAIDCPLADFFTFSLAQMSAFESELFTSPEGRSLNCFVPMPFARSARITLTNETALKLNHLFYDVDYTLEPVNPQETLYFHATFGRQKGGTIGKDLEILPRVQGTGRFLGMSVGVLTDPAYAGSWWGEGEVKVYLDGDGPHPTLVGTGGEDYIGTAWGQGVFAHRTQGCHESNVESGRFSFYRLHTVDPIVFHEDISVTLQAIGGAPGDKLLEIQRNAPLQVISCDGEGAFQRLYEQDGFVLSESNREDAWYNFYREDDYAFVAYYYLDRP